MSVIGASGGIGQPLCLLMKMNRYVSSLCLYDRTRPPGVAVDLSHINTPCSVVGLRGEPNLPDALKGSDIVIITAGVPRKPGMSRDDLFAMNACVVSQFADACAKYCPNAFVLLLTNPINSLLPLFTEVYRRKGIDGSQRLFGMSSLDAIRTATFVSNELHIAPSMCTVPVIGGHAGTTIIPLLSQLQGNYYNRLDAEAITKRIQFGGDEVVAAKEGSGSATLSTAYAIASFTASLLHAMDGDENVVEHAFIQQDYRNCHFFSSKVRLGINGVEEPVPIPGNLSMYEEDMIEKALPVLEQQAEKGREFAKLYHSIVSFQQTESESTCFPPPCEEGVKEARWCWAWFAVVIVRESVSIREARTETRLKAHL